MTVMNITNWNDLNHLMRTRLLWLAFAGESDEERIRRRSAERFGVSPEEIIIIRKNEMWLAAPDGNQVQLR